MTWFLLSLAQSWAAPTPAWVRDAWTTRQGLPQGSVNAIAQDAEGFIWLATYGGLVRFDGQRFETLYARDIEGLQQVRWLSIAIGDDDALWLGGHLGGLVVIRDNQATSYGPQATVRRIEVDAEGTVWAASNAGLLVVRGGELEVRHPDQRVSFVASSSSGVYSVREGGRTCEYGDCSDVPDHAPDPEERQEWWQGPDGTWMASTSSATYRFEEDRWTEQLRHPLTSRPLACTVWRDESWCLTADGPVVIDDVKEEAHSSGAVLFVDRDDGLWAGYDGAGLARLQATPVVHHLEGRNFQGIIEYPPGVVWAASQQTVYPLGTGPSPDIRMSVDVWQDDEEAYAVLGNSVVRLGLEDPTPLWTLSDGRSLGIPRAGPWLSVDGQLVDLRGPSALVAPDVPPGARLVLGDQRGAWLQVGQTLHRYGDTAMRIELPTADRVRDVHVQEDDFIWIATYGNGLLGVEDGEVLGALGSESGGCDWMISQIFDVGDGQLWLSTNRGLGHTDEQQARRALTSGQPTQCVLLGSHEANGARGLLSSDGRIFAPTVDGVAEVSPEAESPRPPIVHLEEVRYGQSELFEGATVSGPDSLTVAFVAPYFREPSALRFRYRLLGLPDADWSITHERRVRFEGLPVGSYTVEVQAKGLGTWGASKTMSFTRRPLWRERAGVRYGLPLIGFVLVLASLATALLATRRRLEEVRSASIRREQLQRELDAQRERNQDILVEIERGRRLESIGRLAAGVAHDFNNLLAVIGSHAEALRQATGDAHREEIDGLLEAVRSGTEVTRGLLVYGETEAGPAPAVDLSALIEERLPLLRRLLRANLRLAHHVEPGCGVRLERGQVDQLLTNLVLNARDAIDGPGTIEVSCGRIEDRVELRVSDDGRGVAPELLAHIFEPYLTTKDRSKGTGLGLATVYGIAASLGGEAHASSTLGEGTTVTVQLPFARPESPTNSEEKPLAELTGRRVLVVDDNAALLTALTRLLTRAGVRAVACHSCDDVLVALREEEADLLLSDVMMPTHSGPDVRDAARQIQPQLPVVFMSGHVASDLRGIVATEAVLPKPFTMDALRQAYAQASLAVG